MEDFDYRNQSILRRSSLVHGSGVTKCKYCLLDIYLSWSGEWVHYDVGKEDHLAEPDYNCRKKKRSWVVNSHVKISCGEEVGELNTNKLSVGVSEIKNVRVDGWILDKAQRVYPLCISLEHGVKVISRSSDWITFSCRVCAKVWSIHSCGKVYYKELVS